jgi:hypothetical protein
MAVSGYDDVNTADGLATAVSEGTQSIRLTDNITIADTITVTRTLALDLNGYILRYGGTDAHSVITIAEGGDLTIEDSSETRVRNYYTINDDGLYVFDESLTSAPADGGYVTGGVITGGTGTEVEVYDIYGGTGAEVKETYGGGIYMSDGALTITGGTIAGNTANFGGGVSGANSVTFTGGTISGNIATGQSYSYAGGVCVQSGTELKASGSVVINDNKVVHGENKTNSNLYLNLGETLKIAGELKTGAIISISQAPSDSSDPSSGFAEGYSFLTGFAENNAGKSVSDFIKSDYLKEEAGKTYEAVTDANGNITWKEYTLVKIPATRYIEIRYDGVSHYSSVISSLNGADVANDDVEEVGEHYIEIDLADGGENTRWEDGSKDPIVFIVKVLPMLIDKPVADTTEFEYNGATQTYHIAENDYYTVDGATQTEAGTHTVTVTLNNPNVAWNDAEESTASLTFDFVISGPTELSLLGVVVVLAATLIIEIIATGVYWVDRRRKEEAAMFHYRDPKGGKGDPYMDDDRNNEHDKFTTNASAGLALTALLSVYVPTWEVVLIVLLTTAIILVAVYNIYLYTRHKNSTAQESTAGFTPAQRRHDNGYRKTNVRADAVTSKRDYTPYVPPHIEQTYSPGEQDLTDNEDMHASPFSGFARPEREEQAYNEGEQQEDENASAGQDTDDADLRVNPVVVYNDENTEQVAIDKTETPAEYAQEDISEDEVVEQPIKEQTIIGQPIKEAATAQPSDEQAVKPSGIPQDAQGAEHVQVLDADGEVEEVLQSVDYEHGYAYVTRYKKSFTARLIQSWDESKSYYSDLKNVALSYKGLKSVVDWEYDCICSSDKAAEDKAFVKFDIRGKTLCVYLALDPDDFKESKFKVERTEIKKFEDVPCLYRIKNPTRARNAAELIAMVCRQNGLSIGRKQNKNYSLPYETTAQLIRRDLIKPYVVSERYEEFLKKSGRSAEEIACDESNKVMLSADDDERTRGGVIFDDEDIVEEKVIDRASGKEVVKRYNKSFKAKIIQASDETKAFYNSLKNEILSYENTKSTIWWNCDSIHTGNKTIAKFAVHGDILCIYLALKLSDYNGTEYQVEMAEGKRNVHVPCMYRVKNAKRAKLAKDLISQLALKMGLNRGATSRENYFSPYESTETLLRRGLIKEIGVKKMVTEQTRKLTKEERENLHRECVEEAEKLKREVVSALDVNNLMDDEVAIVLVDDKHSAKSFTGKAEVVYIDKISANFKAGDVVNLKSLKRKGLVSEDAGGIKVLARGTLTKPLAVEACDYSLEAIKMILLTGGTVKRV